MSLLLLFSALALIMLSIAPGAGRAVFRNGLLWSLGGAFAMFLFGFLVPAILSCGNQGPVLGVFLLPLGAVLGAIGGLAMRLRAALKLPLQLLGIYIFMFVVLVASLLPMAPLFAAFTPAAYSKCATFQPASERMKLVPPLSAEEKHLLETSRLPYSVGVENLRLPPAYTRGLVADLGVHPIFQKVGALNDMSPRPDFVARVERMHYGDRTGQTFILYRMSQPERSITISVYYKIGGVFDLGDRGQYLDRLAVETIKAVQKLELP